MQFPAVLMALLGSSVSSKLISYHVLNSSPHPYPNLMLRRLHGDLTDHTRMSYHQEDK